MTDNPYTDSHNRLTSGHHDCDFSSAAPLADTHLPHHHSTPTLKHSNYRP